MELWACGFNAWGQLQLEGDLPSDPHDLHAFQQLLEDRSIEILKTAVSATLIQTSKGLITTGYPDEFIKICLENGNGLPNVAIGGNDKVAEFESSIMKEYPSLQAYINKSSNTLFELSGNITQLVANQTSFTALSSNGNLGTWGDPRYESCLGRGVSEDSPASRPCQVDDLTDLPTGPIKKLSSGGYVTAVLTEGNDLYVWGGRAGQPKLLEDLSDSPMSVDIEGVDVLDVAIGDNHILALSADHRLFVVGAGGNGQLGLGPDVKELGDWKEVSLPLKAGQKIVGVHAGYKNSFVLVKETTK